MIKFLQVNIFKKLLLIILLIYGVNCVYAKTVYVYDDDGRTKYAYDDGKKDDNSSGSSGGGNSNNSSNSDDDKNKDNSGNGKENGSSSGGGGGSSGSTSSSNETTQSTTPEISETNEINDEASELDPKHNEIAKKDGEVPGAEGTDDVTNETEKEAEELEDHVEGAEDEKDKETEENIKKLEELEKALKELQAGDPVRIAGGFYEQLETDFAVGNLPVITVSRNYSSQNTITSSFGYGWTSNLDERIILGVDAGVDYLEALFRNYKVNLLNLISNYHITLISRYNLTNIYNAKTELGERISLCNENLEQSNVLCASIDDLIRRTDDLINVEEYGPSNIYSGGEAAEKNSPSDENDSSSESMQSGGVNTSGESYEKNAAASSSSESPEEESPGLPGIHTGGQNCEKNVDISPEDLKEKLVLMKDKYEAQRASINTKLTNLQNAYNCVDADLALMAELSLKYEMISAKHAVYANAKELSRVRKVRNSKVMFNGMGAAYDETGFNTLSLIDENGFPHVFYETSAGSNCWINNTENKYLRCEVFGNGYKLYLSDGSVKEFDASGFLIAIEDRFGNRINIQRESDEKIKCITSSSNERLEFEYENNFIKKITNVRSPNENAVYNYHGNKLISVKDTDGDPVFMNYDAEGRMVSLTKCDGSVVSFVHGEQTQDGKVYTTATINEEGYSERFEYDRNRRQTDYINHDGYRTSYWYDENHRTVRELRPDGTDIRSEYDSAGNIVSLNENGNVTSYAYDEYGNKTYAYYSDGSYESWSYDNFGFATSYVDKDGVRNDYIRNAKGNLIEFKINGRTVWGQNFDSKGNVIKRTVYSENPVVTDFKYDDYANVKEEKCGNVITSYLYDGSNRITEMRINGKVISQITYNSHQTKQTDYNGLETTYYTNGRKDIYKVSQKDIITGVIHETRVEYDKRHLPLRVYADDSQNEKLVNSYLYTPEGKIKIEILHGNESWIKFYEYQNDQISEIKQIKVSEPIAIGESENYYRSLLANAGENVYIQKYKYELLNNNKKLLTVTDGLEIKNLFEYDSYGNLIKNTDGNGFVIQKSYTKAGRLKKEQSDFGGWYEYFYSDGKLTGGGEEYCAAINTEYYPDGSVKSVTDRYGKISYYTYDERGNVLSVQSDSKKIWYKYDGLARMTKLVVGPSADEENAVYFVDYEYSEDERTVTVTEGGKYKSILILDAFGNVLKQIDGNNNERSFVYDYQNQMIETYDGYNNKTTYEYNSLGVVSKIVKTDNTQTNYQYNHIGQLEKITDACGIIYSANYDKAGRLIKEYNRSDCEKFYEYDNAGRVTKVMTGGEVIESYTYGSDNRKLVVTDGNGEDYIYNYDRFGRLINERNRNGDEQSYLYDAEGQLYNQNNFDGTTAVINYSADRTVRTVHFSDGTENQFVYDTIGNIIEASNAYGKTIYQYDCGGRMIYQKDITTGEEIYFEYDSAGNRIKLISSNRETKYSYGKNNEVKEIFDNKQRISIKLKYDEIGREVLREFGNGTEEKTVYDTIGRRIIKSQKTARGELIWAEGYVYGEDGKRTATVDNVGRVTLYEYNRKGQLETVYYPYTDEMLENIKSEAELNGLPVLTEVAENKYLTSELKSQLVILMNGMQYGLAYNLTNLQIFIKETYAYDKNGNRIAKITPYGIIEYSYDKENCLISSGSRGRTYVNYSYDKMGNLLSEESGAKITRYAYNAQNRLIYCEVTDKSKKEYSQTTYAYDAFGRRVIVQDAGEAALRTLYDGLTFDVIKQSQIFVNGLFTDINDNGIRWTKSGRPNGDRYRYIGDEDSSDSNRYFYLDENTYKTVSSRYRGERTQISVNGKLAAQASFNYGEEYFSTDLLGSISTVTDNSGTQRSVYSYDVFGTLVQGKLSDSTDFGYLGKQHDSTSRLYNYGYRDYNPGTARFTTIDPIRDGHNWFLYCNNDPVNFVDLKGLCKFNDKTNAEYMEEYKINPYLPTDVIKKMINNYKAAEKDKEFAKIVASFVGTKYVYGGKSRKGIDCSGLITEALKEMGYDIKDTSSKEMASGLVDWIEILPNPSDLNTGKTAMLNFYKLGGAKNINHTNVGVGNVNYPGAPCIPKEQIVDATEGTTLNQRVGREGQYITPKEGQVNQTYAPFSTKTKVTKQGKIKWDVLEESYKNEK